MQLTRLLTKTFFWSPLVIFGTWKVEPSGLVEGDTFVFSMLLVLVHSAQHDVPIDRRRGQRDKVKGHSVQQRGDFTPTAAAAGEAVGLLLLTAFRRSWQCWRADLRGFHSSDRWIGNLKDIMHLQTNTQKATHGRSAIQTNTGSGAERPDGATFWERARARVAVWWLWRTLRDTLQSEVCGCCLHTIDDSRVSDGPQWPYSRGRLLKRGLHSL